MNPMSPSQAEHRDPVTAWRLFWTSDLPLHRRLVVAAGNVMRRFTTPPHDCCGRPGEPGC
ncbi:MAG TPA: hypothetical protein DCK98_05075 [Chloroflexi bacterium]|nr:hypothetical protein [Chloroflexota bacterium]HAL27845.1 hypothetical protein [Chloroflexota bacterium]